MGSPGRRQGAAGHPVAASPLPIASSRCSPPSTSRPVASTSRSRRRSCAASGWREEDARSPNTRKPRRRAARARHRSRADPAVPHRASEPPSPAASMPTLTSPAAVRTGSCAQRMHGPFHLVARDGRVDRMTGLAQDPQPGQCKRAAARQATWACSASGFAYSKFVVTRHGWTGRWSGSTRSVLDAQPFDVVAHGSIDWSRSTVDMNVAVAPLQVLNSVVKLMPFLGYVLGGGVYAVPVGVRGNLSDPQVVPVAPTAVAGASSAMLERTLKTPFNLREALVPPAMQSNAAARRRTLAPAASRSTEHAAAAKAAPQRPAAPATARRPCTDTSPRGTRRCRTSSPRGRCRTA